MDAAPRTPAALQSGGEIENEAQNISSQTRNNFQHGHLPPITPIHKVSSRSGAQVALGGASALLMSNRNCSQSSSLTHASGLADFSINREQLAHIVSFDERVNPEQVRFLNSRFGGVVGVARLLITDIDNGLTLAKRETTAQAQTTRKTGFNIFFRDAPDAPDSFKKSTCFWQH